MKSLLSSNLRYFLLSAIIIMLCCMPLFFYVMKFSYTEDLDELIIFRANEFKEKYLPTFSAEDIAVWNNFNEDMQIIADNHSYPLDKPVQDFLFNKSEGHNIDYRLYYTSIEIEGNSYLLMSRIPMIEDHDLILMQINQYGLLFLILLISLLLVQRFISRKLWRPFYETLEKIKSFNLDKGNVPVFEKTNIREFRQLNNSMEELIGDNLNKYSQQKEFIENASHELQTPISVFHSQLDILLQQPNLTEKHVEIIQSLYNVSARMKRLNKNLLLLAKIDNDHYKEMQEVEVSEILSGQLYYLRYMAEDCKVTINTNFENPLSVTANVFLLESLINNLIVNGIFYNRHEGLLDIIITDNQLIISNTGDGKPLNPDKIFTRFNQTSEENKKGNGLGLSIVHQICKMHGWKIEYVFQDDRHIFTVHFR